VNLSSAGTARGSYSIRLLRGESVISEARRLTDALAESCGQPEAVRDLHYYLGKPGLLKRTPVLLLVTRADGPRDVASMRTTDVIGTVLLFEYSALHIRAGMYTSNDRSGRRTIISAPSDRSLVAAAASKYLLEQGANVVMLSYRSDVREQQVEDGSQNEEGSSWVTRERSIPDYLPVLPTFEETLGRIGKRTRTHMRYYRRRAEADLGCWFDAAAKISEEELRAFNRECMFPIRNKVLSWRLRALGDYADPILMGLRDGEGRLLSVIGGRRQNGHAEIFWQMNRRQFPAYSLSLVMRTYFIEHEAGCGTDRVYLDGGSAHSLCHSFVNATVTDLAVMRNSLLVFAARKFGRWFIPPDNELAHLLVDDGSAAAAVRYESRAA
jgi:hypothetical protein